MSRKSLRKTCGWVWVLICVGLTTAFAQQHDALTPLLADLEGWSAEPAEGMSMDMGTMKMINAVREYQKGAQEISAMVMVGNQAMAMGQMQPMKAETSEGKFSVTTIDGFKVHTQFDKAENKGSLIVFLGQGQTQQGLFTFYYEGFSEADALALARKFDWVKMKAAIDKLL